MKRAILALSFVSMAVTAHADIVRSEYVGCAKWVRAADTGGVCTDHDGKVWQCRTKEVVVHDSKDAETGVGCRREAIRLPGLGSGTTFSLEESATAVDTFQQSLSRIFGTERGTGGSNAGRGDSTTLPNGVAYSTGAGDSSNSSRDSVSAGVAR